MEDKRMKKKIIKPSEDGKYQKRGSKRNVDDLIKVIAITLFVTSLLVLFAVLIYK